MARIVRRHDAVTHNVHDEAVIAEIHTASHEIDPAGIEYWRTINQADKVIPVVRARPWTTFNFHAPSVFAAKGGGISARSGRSGRSFRN